MRIMHKGYAIDILYDPCDRSYGYRATDQGGSVVGEAPGYMGIPRALAAAKDDVERDLGYSQGYEINEAKEG